jgi:hypothetical protein
MNMRKKKAGCGGHQQPANIDHQQPPYRLPCRRVNPPHRSFRGRRDRAPARPLASSDTVSLGLLLLFLSANANGLTSREARKGWGLAARWTERYVTARRSAKEGT